MERAGNVRVRLNTQLVRAEGERRLETLTVRDSALGTTERLAAAAVFVLIGAGPHTGWLAGALQRDSRGYVMTGSAVACDAADAREWSEARAPLALETSLPGVFAAGDKSLSPTLQAVAGKLAYFLLWVEALSGQLAVTDLLIYLSVTVFWLFLTVKVLEARKWS